VIIRQKETQVFVHPLMKNVMILSLIRAINQDYHHGTVMMISGNIVAKTIEDVIVDVDIKRC